MDVAVITVGDELLTGDTVNTNATWLCAELTDRGVHVRRVIVIPDIVSEIVEVVRGIREDYDAVIVTGGLGPTHDDLTMEAIADAFDRPLETNEAAQQWLEEEGGYSADKLAPGTVELPAGASPIHNEVGVAPGAHLENVYVLPGVPEEMRAMFDQIESGFAGTIQHRESVLIDEPESTLVDRIERLRAEFDVSVGSYPGDHVRIRIAGPDEAEVRAAQAWLRERVAVVDEEDAL